jgi:hypothetical protein
MMQTSQVGDLRMMLYPTFLNIVALCLVDCSIFIYLVGHNLVAGGLCAHSYVRPNTYVSLEFLILNSFWLIEFREVAVSFTLCHRIAELFEKA